MSVSLNFFRVFNITIQGLLLIASLAVCASCYAQPSGGFSIKEQDDGFVLLGLVGFNYTDRHISEYSVNGASGGHINLSSPTSGGSGIACCLKISKKHIGPFKMKVRWQVDGCKILESNPRTGASAETRRFYYKEAMVDVLPAVNKSLNFVETHFYPSGEVRVQLTEHGSDPSLVLNEKRPDKSHFPRCENGKNSR